jgi:5-methyltetrahydrofolate--homocysteine methyltransferase
VHAGQDHAAQPHPRRAAQVCLDLIYDRARRDGGDPTTTRSQAARGVRGTSRRRRWRRRTAQRLAGRAAPVHRIIDGDRDGLTDDLDEALAEGLPALDIINDTCSPA